MGSGRLGRRRSKTHRHVKRIEDLEVAGGAGQQFLIPGFGEAAHRIMLGLESAWGIDVQNDGFGFRIGVEATERAQDLSRIFSIGGAEIADAVHGSGKPTVAWAGGMMCSLAYWIGSQAKAVVASRSAMAESIGAYVSVVDFHRMLANAGIEVKVFTNKEGTCKAAGMPGAPVSDEHAAEFTRQAQRSFDLFRADVLRARASVPASVMQGQVFDGADAKRNGRRN